MTERMPGLRVWPAEGAVRGVVLVLHGGAERGHAAVSPWRLAYLRMVPFARLVERLGRRHGVRVALLRNRVYGWNAPDHDPVCDARWALARLTAAHPGLPVALLGHSMGGRVALRVADDPAVVAVCALAPWTPAGEPVAPVTGRDVLIAHGVADRVTSPAESLGYARRAEPHAKSVVRFEVAAEGHGMLRRAAVWNALVRAFAAEAFDLPGGAGTLAAARGRPADERLRLRL
ncbi:alpha/beta hydrolase [Amycolatopsis arida]|uniref:alpha/beta hydrolase n=1 Tax=Amycolatopsis arida TaxID=587909 RepID=UPI000B8380FB|nr:alpha/beta fold hydrolase [Amycolatopsis arida]